MKFRHLVAVLAAFALPAYLVLPTDSLAKPKSEKQAEPEEKKANEKYDSDNVKAISQYVETCAQGNQKAVAKDLPGAIELYRKAINLSPKQPLAHYLLGEAHLLNGNLQEADAAYKQAESLADERHVPLRTKILFVQADLLERQKKWPEARTAWQAYQEYYSKHTDAGGAPQSAASRLQAIDEMVKLETQMIEVRARIEAEKDAGSPKKK